MVEVTRADLVVIVAGYRWRWAASSTPTPGSRPGSPARSRPRTVDAYELLGIFDVFTRRAGVIVDPGARELVTNPPRPPASRPHLCQRRTVRNLFERLLAA